MRNRTDRFRSTGSPVFENASGISTLHIFRLTSSHQFLESNATFLGPNWYRYVSKSFLAGALGQYPVAAAVEYTGRRYSKIRLNSMVRTYKPQVTGVTSKSQAGTPAGELSHSIIYMWFIPNWQSMAEDEVWHDAMVSPQLQSTGEMKKISMNSRANKGGEHL